MDLGDSLLDRSDLAGARAAHEKALIIAREHGDDRSVVVSLGQLGTIALSANNLGEAEARYREGLTTFQALGEPESIAACWHQLGIVYQRQRRWKEAEHAYRQAAQIDEKRAHQSWLQLARVMALQDKPGEAERWYEKALDGYRAAGDGVGESLTLYNLATLLRGRPGRLADIRRHAEQALAIQRTLDPAAAEIWETYKILADVADAEGRADEARTYRRQGRQSFAAPSVSRKWLRQYAPLISAVAAAAADPAQRPALETRLDCMIGRGEGQLIAALRRLLDGERKTRLPTPSILDTR